MSTGNAREGCGDEEPDYFLVVCVLSGTTFADTWTVDDDGKADFDNIQDAVDAASDGDEIIVSAGTCTSTADGVVDILDILVVIADWHCGDLGLRGDTPGGGTNQVAVAEELAADQHLVGHGAIWRAIEGE